jgi:dipeptidyl aminopeptidase/acylaminoacyl peptidase
MRNLPLVVLVHGGPTARDDFEFDWWASFLASRGYAVLQPNFRGSSGYGAAWEEAGYREWGRLMQTDVEDGALVLGRNGIADPERICIVGGSYGGFAALAGAALTPERYACAAAIAGVSDLPMMLSNVAIAIGSQSMPSDWWGMLIGDRREDGAALRAVSPAHQAANVRAPVLLIHGANDTVVPIAQSRRMADALRSAGKDVRLVEYPGEDHWLSDATTRIAMLRELETFLAAHLGAP